MREIWRLRLFCIPVNSSLRNSRGWCALPLHYRTHIAQFFLRGIGHIVSETEGTSPFRMLPPYVFSVLLYGKVQPDVSEGVIWTSSSRMVIIISSWYSEVCALLIQFMKEQQEKSISVLPGWQIQKWKVCTYTLPEKSLPLDALPMETLSPVCVERREYSPESGERLRYSLPSCENYSGDVHFSRDLCEILQRRIASYRSVFSEDLSESFQSVDFIPEDLRRTCVRLQTFAGKTLLLPCFRGRFRLRLSSPEQLAWILLTGLGVYNEYGLGMVDILPELRKKFQDSPGKNQANIESSAS